LKKLLLVCCLLGLLHAGKAQVATTVSLTELSGISKQKFDSYISKKGFAFSGTSYLADTVAKDFDYQRKKTDSFFVQRTVTSFSTGEDFCLSYRTTSKEEYQKIKADIKKEGFYCNREKDSLTASVLLFQHNDITVALSSKIMDTLTEYSFLVRKQELPRPKEIVYADDLVAFNSHENLRFYFGEQNVKRDVYYLSDKKVGKCSVLFPNTNRQVVFLWADGANNCNLAKIYVGGQLMAATNMEYESNIPENLWRLKSGVRPGMSLYQLRRLNDAAFNFNGGNSSATGMIAADSTGKLNFKTESIILGCMNCTDPAFYKKTMINSDDAIQEERILFVQTIILDPVKMKENRSASR
jgi:hypothetical protein